VLQLLIILSISSSTVNVAALSDYVCCEIAEDPGLLVCNAASTDKQRYFEELRNPEDEGATILRNLVFVCRSL